MIAFFPEMYHDELMYSVIAGYHQRSGYALLVSTFEDIYQQKAVIPSFEFVNAYKPDALTWITKNNSFELIIQEHTMFPWYAHFLPIEKKNRAFEALVRQEGNPGNYLGIKKTGGERFFSFDRIRNSVSKVLSLKGRSLSILKDLTSTKEKEIDTYNRMLCTVAPFADQEMINLLDTAGETVKEELKKIHTLQIILIGF